MTTSIMVLSSPTLNIVVNKETYLSSLTSNREIEKLDVCQIRQYLNTYVHMHIIVMGYLFFFLSHGIKIIH
jgi:hypothetical protein